MISLRYTLLGSVTAGILALSPTEAIAQMRRFDVAAQSARTGIPLFAHQAGIQILAPQSLIDGLTVRSVHGNIDAQVALQQLLAGTNLMPTKFGKVVILQRRSQSTAVTRPVAVQANPAAAQEIPVPQVPPASTANSSSADTPRDTEPQTITITGSRLAARGYSSPSPVSMVDSQEFKLSGAQTVETTLLQSPQFVPSGYDSSGNGTSKGVAALNMRGLGEKRSLTLVNGRRYTVTGADNLTDLNTIPAALISRVDIVTGGSSAVYGSDALAGVVNFILRDNFQGVQIEGERRWDQHSNTPTYSVDLTAGANFADDRGNAVISLDYLNRGAILRSQYAYASHTVGDGCVTRDSFSRNAPGTPLAVPTGETCAGVGGVGGFIEADGAATQVGRIANIPLYGSAQSNPGLDAALLAAGLRNMTSYGFTFDGTSNVARPAIDPQDRYNNAPPNYMQTPLQRVMLNTFINYKFNKDVTGYIEGHFSDYSTYVKFAPNSFSGNWLINVNNPYLQPQVQEVLHQLDLAEVGTTVLQQGSVAYTNSPGDGLTVLNINKRFPEDFPRTETEERNVLRIATGVKGNVFGNLKFDLYGSYARTKETDIQTGNFSTSMTQAALLSQNGAAPVLNPFGLGSISAAAEQAVGVTSTNTAVNEQYVVSGTIGGPIFTLPAGTVDFSAGFEWRRNSLISVPDALLALGDIVGGVAAGAAVNGSTSVKELYGELRVPILADRPFFNRLSVTAASRYSKYDTQGVGGVFTDSAGVQWKPVRDILVRAQYQRAIRAPNVSELFAASTLASSSVSDPCSSRAPVAQQTATVRAVCEATGVPAATVFTGVVQPNPFVYSRLGGNESVGPETSDTYTLGLVLTPHWIPRLAISVDWYKVKIDGAIAPLALNAANLLDLCYYTIADATSAYCRAIHRDPLTGEISGNNGYLIDQGNSNTGGIKVSGVDIDAQYTVPIGFSPLGGASRITVSSQVSYTDKYTFVPVQALPDVQNDCAGKWGVICGFPAPRWKGNLRITWETGPLTLSIKDRYTGAIDRDQPLDISLNHIPAYDYVDLSFAIDLPHGLEADGGIDNVASTLPPYLGSGAANANTAPGVYEIYGRTFYLGLKMKI